MLFLLATCFYTALSCICNAWCGNGYFYNDDAKCAFCSTEIEFCTLCDCVGCDSWTLLGGHLVCYHGNDDIPVDPLPTPDLPES